VGAVVDEPPAAADGAGPAPAAAEADPRPRVVAGIRDL